MAYPIQQNFLLNVETGHFAHKQLRQLTLLYPGTTKYTELVKTVQTTNMLALTKVYVAVQTQQTERANEH